MIVISEYKLTKEQIKEYRDKGFRIAYGYEDPVIRPKEAVGFLVNTLFKSTIDLIEKLLYFNHNITIKYDDKVYKLNKLEEWKYTHQSDTDQLKVVTRLHPVYKAYLDKRSEYFQKQKDNAVKKQYEVICKGFGVDYKDLPSDHELQSFVKAFAYLYQVDVDYNDRLDMIRTYYQLQYYLDNDIPYANEPMSIAPEDEPMLVGKFQVWYEEPIEEIAFGNEIYMEDFIYQNI